MSRGYSEGRCLTGPKIHILSAPAPRFNLGIRRRRSKNNPNTERFHSMPVSPAGAPGQSGTDIVKRTLSAGAVEAVYPATQSRSAPFSRGEEELPFT
ncbi:hypothetical protein ASZ90_009069 [hydrocarbon metagenome]|uniref:Uncharacterized protein n=1 Tax=hydrocarbon metagenome TaxID=938273 RepID=A0A0W8FKB0_9ZZZZ